MKALCAKAREILVEESNVQRVDSPVTVGAIKYSCECLLPSLLFFFFFFLQWSRGKGFTKYMLKN